MSTIAMYYFQGLPGESMEYPNAFVIPNTDKPTLQLFLEHFPLSGQFHFRFRQEDPSHGYVWLDATSPAEVLPMFNSCIMAKVLKTDEASALTRKSALKKKNTARDLSSKVPPSYANGASRSSWQASQERYSDYPSEVDEQKERRPQVQSPLQSKSSPTHPAGAPVGKIPKPPQQPQQQQQQQQQYRADSKDMLDGDNPQKLYEERLGSQKSSSFKDDAYPPEPAEPESKIDLSASSKNLDRAQLQQNKQEAIDKQVQEALDAKIEKDRKEWQEQRDFDSAKEKYEQRLLAWSTNNKEKRNVRSLLSTMHTVLWEGSRWKSIGLGDVLEPQQVKKQYRKAMLVVHPDHCVNLNNEQKFVSKRVFEAVNEAYNEFLKKESV